MCDGCTTDSPTLVGRRGLLRGALIGSAAVAAGGLGPATAAAQDRPGPAGVTFRWLGVAGWELAFDGRRVLIDPYLSRFRYTKEIIKDGRPVQVFDPNAPLTVTEANLAPLRDHPAPVELILITHGHWDHMADVPYLLKALDNPGKATPKAMGTETHRHLLTAMGADPGRLVPARGGEYLDFGGYTVQAFGSVHGTNAQHQYFAPGTLASRPAEPTTISHLVEGGMLAYQVSIGDRLRVVFTGSGGFIEREFAGLRPHVAVLSLTPTTSHDYLARAIIALGRPPYLVPSHHDAMDTPLGQPGIDQETMRAFRETVRRVSPHSVIKEPANHLVPFTL